MGNWRAYRKHARIIANEVGQMESNDCPKVRENVAVPVDPVKLFLRVDNENVATCDLSNVAARLFRWERVEGTRYAPKDRT